MVITMNVLADCLGKDVAATWGLMPGMPRLRTVRRLPVGDIPLSQDVVYVATQAELSWRTPIANKPNLVLLDEPGAADALPRGCHALTVRAAGYRALVERVQDVFLELGEWETRVLGECIHKDNLVTIFTEMGTVFPNPMVMDDNGFKVIAVAGSVPDPPVGAWAYLDENGFYDISSQMRKNPRTNFDATFTSRKARWYTKDELDTPLIIAPLFVGGSHFAEISLTETHEPLTAGQFDLLCWCQETMASYLDAMGVSAFGQPSSSVVLDRMLSGKAVSDEIVETLARQHGWKIDDAFYLLRFELPAGGNGAVTREALANMLPKGFPKAILSIQGDVAVALVRETDCSHPQSTPAVRTLRPGDGGPSLVDRLHGFESLRGVTYGASEVALDLRDARQLFLQAGLAAKMARRRGLPGAFFRPGLAAIISSELEVAGDVKAFCDPRVLQLARIDAAEGSEYLRTLHAVLACGTRLREAAAELGIHRNTLTYRLERIRERACIDLGYERDVSQLLLSCMLLGG